MSRRPPPTSPSRCYQAYGLRLQSALSLPELHADDHASGRIDVSIRLAPALSPDVLEGDVRAYLLGTAIGALLHQRGLLPLHASAVEVNGRAVAFIAPAGHGK